MEVGNIDHMVNPALRVFDPYGFEVKTIYVSDFLAESENPAVYELVHPCTAF